MRPDALFWIAPQSKAMTAAALMMLVDEGRVKLDSPVKRYLPEFKGQMLAVEQDADHVALRKPMHPITMREILSHPSGLGFAVDTDWCGHGGAHATNMQIRGSGGWGRN